MDVISATASGLFATASSQQAQLENLAQRQLASALELYQGKKYDEAISAFKRTIGLAPLSSTATNAYDYMARAYLNKGDERAAIAAYRESLRVDPTNGDTYAQLGKIHVTQGDLAQARTAFESAVRLDPSAANRYALGQTYLEMGDYDQAQAQFKAVKELEPGKPNGDYGLGLVYAKQGRSQDAIAAFKRAISQQRDFWYAHAEMGYVLADMGEREQASAIAQGMKGKADDLADTLNAYIYEKTPAKMVAVFPASTFQKSLGPKTAVASLGEYLANPGDQQTFSMIFAFDKKMDARSVENVLNWTISRTYGAGRGTAYNFGMPVPETEITLDRHPVSVSYSAEDQIATVLFRVTQNATGDGTLDPSHIRFSFSGTDVLGLRVSDQADEYTGFSGFA